MGARHKGFALMLLLLVVGVGISAVLFSFFSSNRVSLDRNQKTASALARAREALIGYAAGNGTVPGVLPCPNTSTNPNLEGNINAPCGGGGNTAIGRLPWQSLGLPDLRDGYGECLWYAVSRNFKNGPAPASLNNLTTGTLAVADGNGTVLSNAVVAVVFAPGASLANQDRTGIGLKICGGNATAANYLDAAAGVNNATNNAVQFVAAQASDTFNDGVLYITTAQLFPPVDRRVATEIMGAGPGTQCGLKNYFMTKIKFPWPTDSSRTDGKEVSNLPNGFFPWGEVDNHYFPSAGPPCQNTAQWLFNAASLNGNGSWLGPGLSIVGYAVTPDQMQATITIDGISAKVCGAGGVLVACP